MTDNPLKRSSVKVDNEYSILFRRCQKKKSAGKQLTREVMVTKSGDPTFRVPHT